MSSSRIDLSWQVGHSSSPSTSPARWVPAVVPGAVQLDWARAEGWGDHTYGENYKQYGWMEDVFWTYTAKIPATRLAPGQHLFFVCGGVDYHFDVRVDGTVLLTQEGMFTPVELDLTAYAAKGGELQVVVRPAPKHKGAPRNRREADQCCKPAVSYGWDWHPRLIPLGIWQETYLEVREASWLHDAEVRCELADDLGHADLTLLADVGGTGAGKIRWTVEDAGGRVIHQQSLDVAKGGTISAAWRLESPELWWPHDQGTPVLYRSRVELLDGGGAVRDSRTSRFGVRKVELVMHPGAWEEPKSFPKTRSNPPITVRVNGRDLFARGSNWVNPTIFPGTISAETYTPLLKLAVEANFNLLRVWGGGIVNKESFYEQCDEMGLMVWQEFPLSCNNYIGTEPYLKVLDQESKSIIRRLRRHACMAIWCGGNELFNVWSGMTDQSLPVRLLNRNTYDLDPKTPWIPTSPLMGMGHGNYLFTAPFAKEVYALFNEASNTAYTEFGVPGPTSVELLKKFIPADELWPAKRGGSYEAHHGFEAWDVAPEGWLCQDILEKYFGPTRSLEELVERGQWLQCEGYKQIFEEGRRQKPRCSMTLNWCYNEPWPCAANNSIVSFPAEAKPSFYAVKASCRPVLASARVAKFMWNPGEEFAPELFLLNDSPNALAGSTIEATLEAGGQKVSLGKWEVPASKANANVHGPKLSLKLPQWKADRMILKLSCPGHPERDSAYAFRYRGA